MSYQQWNQQQFQPVGAGPVLIQPWQRELGCTALRPRSFSLGSRPAMTSSSDLFEVSSKRPNNPAPTILPLDNNYNSNKRRNTSGQSKYKCAGRSLLVLLLLAGSLVATLGWWRLRHNNPSSPVPESHPIPELASPSQQQQQHSAYHPLPPPPPALVPPSWQQQQPQQHQVPHHQPHQQQQAQHYYPYQQQQQQQQQQQYYQPEPVPQQYAQPQHYQYGQQQMYPHHQQVQQQQQQQPAYVQQQQQYYPPQQNYQPQQQQQQQYSYSQPPVGHHPEMMHHQGEPDARKPWMLEHMDVPVVSPPQQAQQQQQQYYQPPPPPVEPVVIEPEMTRQEERAQARKDARTMNPTKAPKISDSDNIWETEVPEVKNDLESNATMVEESPELQLDSVENSFSESVESSDGETVFLTSFEDSEDVTIETVME